ncbi:TMV resistance protein N [Vitis vinifera]|uniref:TMV resistance protein N n=1 Tax=Vitis vinifera TaxID=29760 RepID=A0A438G7V1_VITVI|nr:TMV resistance protein N [Vitis vinifera]
MLISRPKLLCISANLVGFDSRLEEMSSLLCMESNDVRMIGIHGIGGIGKTTLAIGIYNQIAHQFEGASFLPNAAEHRGSLIQRKLLADILGEKIARISNIDEGISLIKKTLCSRKVLIILDDVSALTQLEFLAGSRHWFGSGSRIIITSRNKHLLDVHEVDGLYEVQKLKSEEAFKLFSLYAFEAPDDRFWELSGRALNYCDGLPLAVKVVGFTCVRRRSLNGKMNCLS